LAANPINVPIASARANTSVLDSQANISREGTSVQSLNATKLSIGGECGEWVTANHSFARRAVKQDIRSIRFKQRDLEMKPEGLLK
jgi:hypothetical protein